MSALATLFHEVESAFRPTGVTLQEKEEAFHLEALVAGVKPAEIDLSFEKGALSIEAKSERYRYSYLIPFSPGQIDETAVDATVADGILQITLPKTKAAKPFKITVKSQ